MRFEKDSGFIVDESIGSIFDQQFFKFDNSLAPRIPIQNWMSRHQKSSKLHIVIATILTIQTWHSEFLCPSRFSSSFPLKRPKFSKGMINSVTLSKKNKHRIVRKIDHEESIFENNFAFFILIWGHSITTWTRRGGWGFTRKSTGVTRESVNCM